jgi:hypothetical protein
MMSENEALQEMNRIAGEQGYEITQGVVYGSYSNRRGPSGVRVRDMTRTYEKPDGDKLTIVYYAESDEIRY